MTTAIDRAEEKRHLERLTGYRDMLRAYVWTVEIDDDGMHIVAQRGGEAVRIATIHRAATPDEVDVLCRALDTLRFCLGLIERALAFTAGLRKERERAENKAKADNLGFSAKGLCEQVDFRRFLEGLDDLGPVPNAQAADTRLKSLLAIQSKGEINRDERARAAFLDLRRRFYKWRRGEG